MAYVHSAATARDIYAAPASGAAAVRKPGFLRRLIVAVQDARMRQVEREIALYLRRSGGAFTDETEREIERRFLFTRG